MNQSSTSIFRSMLGAFVGDAAGATLEFERRPVTKEAAEEAMRMPGGGVLRVGPGQITDDGELTLALWSAIHQWDSYYGIPRTNMLRAYAEWYKSRPFDCGYTCGYAFSEACAVIDATKEGESLNYAQMTECEQNVKEHNKLSEANGAMMRATALATWIASHPNTPITHCIGLAKTDAELSHPSEVCCETNQIYVLAICHLLRGEDPVTTLRYISDYVEEKVNNESVRRWFFHDSLDISEVNCDPHMGHARWAFTLAIYFLRNPHISYEEAIYTTLMKGGDTDTNACIVGGLVACYQPIPESMLRPVLTFDCTQEGRLRPEAYSVKKWFGE